jgi:hypothetical protein
MKKNKRDNAKTPTNYNTVAKLNPTPQKRNIEHTRARAQEEILLIHNLSQSLTKNYPQNSITGKLENKHQSNSKRGSKQSKARKKIIKDSIIIELLNHKRIIENFKSLATRKRSQQNHLL